MHLLAAASALNVLDPQSLLANLGALGVFLAMFAETGLLVGFFLPGDSLLFTAGLLCSTPVSGIVCRWQWCLLRPPQVPSWALRWVTCSDAVPGRRCSTGRTGPVCSTRWPARPRR